MAGLTAGAAARADTLPIWQFFGGDLFNSRGHVSGSTSVDPTTQLNSRNAAKIALKWSYSTAGDVSATPTVDSQGVYFPDYAGYLYALDPNDGSLIWSSQLSDYMGGTYGFSRNSPAIGALGEIIVGNNSANSTSQPGARVLSINKSNGDLKWLSIIDPNSHSFVSSSPIIYNGIVYVGVASLEESLTVTVPGFVPVFRGSLVALNEQTGAIIWKTYMSPPGYAGAAIWGSGPAVFPAQNSVIVTTGNNYAVPDSVAQCYTDSGADTHAQNACMDPTNYVDAMVSLDLKTGKPKWARKFSAADTWVVACKLGPQSACPIPTGGDNDFAQGPVIAWVNNYVGVADDRGGTSNNYFIGAGEKTGMFWGINPINGGQFWSTYVGVGQIFWGSAVNTSDHNSVFVALSNSGHATNTLAGVKGGSAVQWKAGAWGAISIATGKFLWQVPTYGADLVNPQFGGSAPGPITETNRIVFAGSSSGYFTSLDANSGKVIWKYGVGAPIIGGPAVYNETLYWGAGNVKSGTPSSHTMFAFAVPKS